jgi:hypothetical protein
LIKAQNDRSPSDVIKQAIQEVGGICFSKKSCHTRIAENGADFVAYRIGAHITWPEHRGHLKLPDPFTVFAAQLPENTRGVLSLLMIMTGVLISTSCLPPFLGRIE